MAGRGRAVPVTASQMRKIHVLAREYGLDDGLLHVHVQTVTGKDSLRELSLGEAAEVIDSLEKRSPGQMTWKQKCLIDRLMKALGWTDGQGAPDYRRLDGFCRSRYGTGSHKWLTRAEASKIIEGLKNMAKDTENACGDQGGGL